MIFHDALHGRALFHQLSATFHMGITGAHGRGIPVPQGQHLQVQITGAEGLAQQVWPRRGAGRVDQAPALVEPFDALGRDVVVPVGCGREPVGHEVDLHGDLVGACHVSQPLQEIAPFGITHGRTQFCTGKTVGQVEKNSRPLEDHGTVVINQHGDRAMRCQRLKLGIALRKRDADIDPALS